MKHLCIFNDQYWDERTASLLTKLLNLETLVINKGFQSSVVANATLPTLRNLESLTLFHALNDHSVQIFCQLSKLKCLDLSYCKEISQLGWEKISKMTQLTSLSAASENLNDKNVSQWSNLMNLRELLLTNNQNLLGSFLAAIATLIKLRVLDLSACKRIDQSGERYLPHIGKLRSLTRLDLSFTGVWEEDFKHLGELTNLRALILRKNPNIISRGRIRHMHHFSQIDVLEL